MTGCVRPKKTETCHDFVNMGFFTHVQIPLFKAYCLKINQHIVYSFIYSIITILYNLKQDYVERKSKALYTVYFVGRALLRHIIMYRSHRRFVQLEF